MSVTYFMSGICYHKGTENVAQQFNGFITMPDIDPIGAHDEMIKLQAGRSKQAGQDVFVHIQQFNEVRTK